MSPVARIDVTVPVGEPPLRRFLGRLPLTLGTGAAGDRPRIDPTTSRFRGSLHHHDYDALDPGPLTASVSSTAVGDERRVTVTLDAPRQVRRLSSTADAGATLSLYRVDGSTYAVEPTVTTGQRTSGNSYAVQHSFVDGRFGVEGGSSLALDEVLVRSEPAGVALAVVSAALSDTAAAAAVPAWRSPTPTAAEIDLGEQFAAAVQAAVDELSPPLPASLQLSVVVTADAPMEVAVLEVAAPHVLVDEGFAPLPLVASDVADPEALVTALRVPRDPVAQLLRSLLEPPTRSLVDRDEVTAAALVPRVLAELSDALSTAALWDPARFAGVAVPADLVAAATAGPMGERLVRVNRRLLEVALDGVVRPRSEQRVLDLGDRPTVAVRRPPGGPVVSATVLAAPDRDAGAAVSDGTPVDGFAATDAIGVEVTTTAWVAAAVEPAAAVGVDAVEVLLLGVRSPTDVLLEVREDHAGLPTGRVLAGGTAPAPSGPAQWVRVALDRRVVLPTTAHWVALRAAEGRALWMAGTDGAARWALDDGDGWVDGDRDVGGPPRVRLVTLTTPSAVESSFVVAVDGEDLPPLDPSAPTVRDLSGAFATGTSAAPELAVIAPSGTGTIRLEPPVVVYEPA